MSTDQNLIKLKEEITETNMPISIELAEKMLIKFDGSKSKLYEFIDNCDTAYSLVKSDSKAILFAIIKTKLTDNARAIARNRSFEDWPSLKSYLLDTYSEKRTMAQWQLELNSSKQEMNENVMSFATKIENCYVKLINSLDDSLSEEARSACINLLKNEALNVFLTGLNKELSLIVKSQKPTSLESAIALAVNEEQEQKSKLEISKYQNINSSSAKFCNFCNKSGHTSFNCRFNINTNHNKNFKFKTEQNIRHVQQFQNSENSNIRVRNNNNSFVKFCNYCKNKGHIIQECRKREYNNNKKRQSHINNDNTHSSNFINSNPNFSYNRNNNQTRQDENLPSTSQNSTLNEQGSRPAVQSRDAHLIRAEFH